MLSPPQRASIAFVLMAHSDGILVSDVVRQAVAGRDFEFEDRGEVELTGFDQPLRAWAARWE